MSGPEYYEHIKMNANFKKVLSMFFWEFGLMQYFLTILTSVRDFIS